MDALDKLRKTKKQFNLLSTVTQDADNDVGPADHQHNSMWDFLKKYKNNHTASLLPQNSKAALITGPSRNCQASPDSQGDYLRVATLESGVAHTTNCLGRHGDPLTHLF